jgi:hypothetical protein
MNESSPAFEERKTDIPSPARSDSFSSPNEKIDLPPPIEITKIAAILIRGGILDKKAAIDEALALYLQTEARYNELGELTFERLLKEIGDLGLLDWVSERAGRRKKLRLYPDKARVDSETQRRFFDGQLDKVRSYLHKKAAYLSMKKTRSVQSTIRLYFRKTAHDHNLKNKKKIEELEKELSRLAKQRTREKGRTVTVEEIQNGMQLWHDQTRRDGDREYDDFMSKAAVWADGNLLYWELSEGFLETLIDFRRGLKERHIGIRDLEAELKHAVAAKRGKKRAPRK